MLAEIKYRGGLRTEAIHSRSGSVIETDAPVDNQGKGERFSPTDLVATSLGSCMLTIMGIYAGNNGIDMTGVKVSVEKIMGANPRRISEIRISFDMAAAGKLSEDHRKALENAARTCPVSASLREDLIQTVAFNW